MPTPRLPARHRLARGLRRWGPFWIVGLTLLAASEMLWQWQTWPVRALLASLGAEAS